MLTIMGGISEFEPSLIRKRCQDGIDRAKARLSFCASWPDASEIGLA
jgi:hypothetical protein